MLIYPGCNLVFPIRLIDSCSPATSCRSGNKNEINGLKDTFTYLPEVTAICSKLTLFTLLLACCHHWFFFYLLKKCHYNHNSEFELAVRLFFFLQIDHNNSDLGISVCNFSTTDSTLKLILNSAARLLIGINGSSQKDKFNQFSSFDVAFVKKKKIQSWPWPMTMKLPFIKMYNFMDK